MLVRVLGPLQLGRPGSPVEVPARKARQLITLLALAALGTVSIDQLTEALWDDPPASAVKTVQSLVSTPGFLSVDSYLDEPRMVSALRRHELERFVAGLEPPGGEVS